MLLVFVRNGVRVPQDVSITGFDDAPIARLSAIEMTTVRQDRGLMGVEAVDAAVRRIENTGLKEIEKRSAPQASAIEIRQIFARPPFGDDARH